MYYRTISFDADWFCCEMFISIYVFVVGRLLYNLIFQTQSITATRLATNSLILFLVLPAITGLFSLELISDSFYNFYEDKFFCQGCFSMQWHSITYQNLDAFSPLTCEVSNLLFKLTALTDNYLTLQQTLVSTATTSTVWWWRA